MVTLTVESMVPDAQGRKNAFCHLPGFEKKPSDSPIFMSGSTINGVGPRQNPRSSSWTSAREISLF